MIAEQKTKPREERKQYVGAIHELPAFSTPPMPHVRPGGSPADKKQIELYGLFTNCPHFPYAGRPNMNEKKVSGRFVNRPYMLGYGISLAVAEVSLGDEGGIEENTARRKKAICRGNSRIARIFHLQRFSSARRHEKRGLAARIPAMPEPAFRQFPYHPKYKLQT